MLKKLVLLKNNQLYNKIIELSLFFFILSLFFPIRYVFLTPEAYLTGQYSDFTSFSLYLSDILFFATCFLLILPRGREILLVLRSVVNGQLSMVLLTFWLILGLILHFSHTNLFWTLKWLELIVAYGTVKLVFSDKRIENRIESGLPAIFVGFSVIQSIIALLQFYKQTSLGLYRLGESHLSPSITGIAKIIVNGETYIRGYGTFPHPNVLSAFLVVGILLGVYKFINSQKSHQIWWGVSIFLNILGLTVTFSRAAYLSLGISLSVFIGYTVKILVFDLSTGSRQAFMEKLKFSKYVQILFSTRSNNMQKQSEFIKNIFMVAILIIISTIFSFLLFRSFLLTRVTISDNAVTERVEYNNIGLRMIKDNPIFGVGAGESVLHMEQYSNKPLEPWQKQPIHNYFLLSAAELGIPGMLLLIWIFLSHLKSAYTDFLVTRNPLLVTILCSFLVLMLFDHYFYTLQQTQLLLWITLGIIAATKKEAIAP